MLFRSIEVTAAADAKTYDSDTSSDGKSTITSSLGLAPGDSANWIQTFDTKDAGSGKTLTPTGTVSDGNDGANYHVTFVAVHTGVITKAELTVTAENKSSQYSDHLAALTFTLSGFVPGEDSTTCGVSGSPAYTTPGLSDPITQAPGDYPIIPSLGTLAAINYHFNFTNGIYTVTPEDAVITFDLQNPVSVKVVAPNEGNIAFTWKATIEQTSDGSLCDLTQIKLEDITINFAPVGPGTPWTQKATTFDPETGVATFLVPENKLGVETYAAKVSLANQCFLASPVEEVLVVYDPSLGFTTGGGWFYWQIGRAHV